MAERQPAGAVVNQEMFASCNTVALASSLVGKLLVRRLGEREEARWITEVEAYDGEQDLACHASRGRTKRTSVLYGPPGCWYVYFIYGIHEMLNLVTGPPDYPAAILIRGVTGISGPGRLTRALQVDRRLNGKPAQPESGLHFEDAGVKLPPEAVVSTPRIGVDYAGPIWSAKLYRFVISPDALGIFSADRED